MLLATGGHRILGNHRVAAAFTLAGILTRAGMGGSFASALPFALVQPLAMMSARSHGCEASRRLHSGNTQRTAGCVCRASQHTNDRNAGKRSGCTRNVFIDFHFKFLKKSVIQQFSRC